VWHYLAFDKEMDSWRTPEQLEEVGREILACIKEIEAAKDFPAIVSSLCDWCIYRHLCPMWRHGVELEAKSPNEYLDDPGVKLVDEYVRVRSALEDFTREAREKLEKLKEALVTFCQKEKVSVVFGTESKITVKEQESLQFPAKNSEERKKLVEILKQSGKWEEVADLDVYALTRAVKNKEWDEAVLKMLKDFGALEITHRLTVSRK